MRCLFFVIREILFLFQHLRLESVGLVVGFFSSSLLYLKGFGNRFPLRGRKVNINNVSLYVCVDVEDFFSCQEVLFFDIQNI